MTEQLTYSAIITKLGWIAIMVSGKGLFATTLPQRSEEHALMALGQAIFGAARNDRGLGDIASRLEAYAEGKQVAFSDKLDLSAGTPFQQRVWETTRRIPYGETKTYLWVARQIKRPRAARAVGQALGANPVPIIVPCHRVIASDGGLGGFGGGLEMKQQLLRLEQKKA